MNLKLINIRYTNNIEEAKFKLVTPVELFLFKQKYVGIGVKIVYVFKACDGVYLLRLTGFRLRKIKGKIFPRFVKYDAYSTVTDEVLNRMK